MSSQGPAINGFLHSIFSESKPTNDPFDSDQEDSLIVESPKQVQGDVFHSRFYLPEEFVVLKAESTLFRVPRFVLNQHSAKFHQLLPPTPKLEAPLQLDDIRAIEFERFLSILLPTEIGQYDVSSFEEWMSVLKVAHKWDCSSVVRLAIGQITPLLSAVDKVVIGHEYDVHEWISEGYIELCQREASISPEEGHRLGVEDVVHISNIRFQLLSQTGARIQNGSLLKLCFGPKRHLLGSNRVLSFIGKTKKPVNGNADSTSPSRPPNPSTARMSIVAPAVRSLEEPKAMNGTYTQYDGNFFAWLLKRRSPEKASDLLAFKERTNSDAFVEEMDKAQLNDIAYTPVAEREGFDVVSYLSISSMPRFKAYSFEELRLYDYIQGRKSAPCPPKVEVPTLEASPQPPAFVSLFGGSS